LELNDPGGVMNYKTLLVKDTGGGLIVTINRPSARNSLNTTMLAELNQVLDMAEQNPDCRFVALQGQQGMFCTGMDFQEVSESDAAGEIERLAAQSGKDLAANPFMAILKRFTLSPKIIVTLIDGVVMAGGVGFVAASDLAIATPRSSFTVSEALWGLLPAVVAPFLVRRVGFQAAYRMALTTATVTAARAADIALVDEVCDDPRDCLHRLWLRLSKLKESTVGNLKRYFRDMWIVDEAMETRAVSEISNLLAQPEVLENIINFAKYKRLPWEN
jgi:polyketide biosynthesis enoyl-CoA hydratase PksH